MSNTVVTDMVSFEAFRAVDGAPVYLQIINFIKRGAIAGTIRDGDELPSRRVLSALLGINPNTVQKAFHILEEEHLMESRTGAKSCMTLPPDTLDALRREVLSDELRAMARTLRQLGISKEEALRLIEQAWEEEAQ
ncbi:MAG: GntR family transcriptional regulator [Oscillospiraceae bacterium]